MIVKQVYKLINYLIKRFKIEQPFMLYVVLAALIAILLNLVKYPTQLQFFVDQPYMWCALEMSAGNEEAANNQPSGPWEFSSASSCDSCCERVGTKRSSSSSSSSSS
jgi:hypothetical protein